MVELHRRKYRESYFDHNFRILCEMLRIGPWNRLPLTIRWLNKEFVRNFPVRENGMQQVFLFYKLQIPRITTEILLYFH